MRERIDEFHDKGVTVYAIAPSNAAFISKYIEAFGPFPFPILGDPNKEAYYELGHKTSPKWKLLSQAAFGFMFGKVKNFIPKDERQKKVVLTSMKKADVYIQGGTYVFSENGKPLSRKQTSSPSIYWYYIPFKFKLTLN